MSEGPAPLPKMMEGLPRDLAERLWSGARLINLPAGRSPVSEGATSNTVYIVLKGRLQVTLFSLCGREVILGDLEEGAIFGELAAIDDEPRSASVVALSECVLAMVDAATFRAATTQSPASADWLARRLAGQIRGLTKKLFESNTLPVRSRLHCELLRLCAAAEESGGSGLTIEPAPTHAELASRVGTHREAVTREMSYLTHQGILQQQRRRLTVLDRLALARLVRAATGEPATLN